jgi:hypothetical protein
MGSDFPQFEFGVIASVILNKTVSDFLLLAWSLIQGLGSSNLEPFLSNSLTCFEAFHSSPNF